MSKQLKPYLVDVPVRVQVWIRPECQRKQFEVLKQARPSIMFLCSDGGRNEKEWAAIRENRAMFDNEIDWECKIYKLYETENKGLYGMGKKMNELIWSNADRCVFLEDDMVPSVSYFSYCAEVLEKFKDDERIVAVNGMNYMGIYEDVQADYFFTRYGAIWGLATWRRVVQQKNDFSYATDSYVMNLLLKNAKKSHGLADQIVGYAKGELVNGHSPGGEFWYGLFVYSHNQLFVSPRKNMISNIGCTEDGAHATEYKKLPKGIRRVFNMETYELDHQIKHTNYVIPDYDYEKYVDRVMGWNHPFIAFYRKIEGVLRRLYYGDGKIMFKKLIRKIKGEKRYEK